MSIDVGTLIYFDEPKLGLNDMVILDPQWLADVMATLVTFKANFVNDGILQREYLHQVWKQYPIELHETLLRLLMNFGVAFPLQGVRVQQAVEFSKTVENTLASAHLTFSKTGTAFIRESAIQESSSNPRIPISQHSSASSSQITVQQSLSNFVDPSGRRSNVVSQYIIPSLLPDLKPNQSLREVWSTVCPSDCIQFGRIFEVDFNLDFGKLLVRIIHIPQLQWSHQWRDGVLVSDQAGQQVALIEWKPSLMQLMILVRMRREFFEYPHSPSVASYPTIRGSFEAVTDNSPLGDLMSNTLSGSDQKSQAATLRNSKVSDNRLLLFRVLLEMTENVFDGFYPGNATITRMVPCSHCSSKQQDILSGAFSFKLEDVVSAVTRSKMVMYCRGVPSRPVNLRYLAPDITFSDFPILQSDQLKDMAEIGRGGFGVVFKVCA